MKILSRLTLHCPVLPVYLTATAMRAISVTPLTPSVQRWPDCCKCRAWPCLGRNQAFLHRSIIGPAWWLRLVHPPIPLPTLTWYLHRHFNTASMRRTWLLFYGSLPQNETTWLRTIELFVYTGIRNTHTSNWASCAFTHYSHYRMRLQQRALTS